MAHNTYGGETFPVLPFKRFWAVCPYCGKNVALFNNTANCSGVFPKCKQCGQEFELKIIMGVQDNPARKSKV